MGYWTMVRGRCLSSRVALGFLLALGLLLLLLGAPPVSAQEPPSLYMTDNLSDKLYTLDPATGAATAVGPGGLAPAAPSGMAFDPNGTLYMVDYGSDKLYTVNTTSGLALEVGTSGLGPASPEGLAFDSSDTLYMVDSISDQLYTVNTTTGAATAVGTAGLGTSGPEGLAFDSSDTLYMVDSISDQLYTVNTTTGAATQVGSTGTSGPRGIAFLILDPPAQVSGVTLQSDTPGSIGVSWSAVTGATGYKVQWSTISGDYDAARQDIVDGGSTTSATIEPVLVGTTYYVQVKALRDFASADGELSSEASVTTVLGSAEHLFGHRPDNFIAQVDRDSPLKGILAQWDEVDTAESYLVRTVIDGMAYLSDTDGATFKRLDVPADTTEVLVSVRGWKEGQDRDGNDVIMYTLETVDYPARWEETIVITTDIPYTPGPASASVASFTQSVMESIGMEPYQNAAGEMVNPAEDKAEMLAMLICGAAAVGLAALLFMVTGGNVMIASVGATMVWSGIGPIFFSLHPAVAYGPLLLIFVPAGMVLIRRLQ